MASGPPAKAVRPPIGNYQILAHVGEGHTWSTHQPLQRARDEKIDAKRIPDLVRANFKLKPREIIDSLNLRRPIYRKTASYGHFGRNDSDFTWEATDKAAKLAADAGLKPELVAARK